VEGIGEDFVPAIAELGNVKTAYTIDDATSFTAARELLKREGIASGSSTGTLLAAALRPCRAQTTPKRIVTFVCDTGTRYLSKVFNDAWMFDQGLLKRPPVGDLRDLISRRFEDDAVISVAPDDLLLTAFQRMRASDVSQLPVLQDGRLVGLLDESDLLLRVHDDSARLRDPVKLAMSQRVETLLPSAGFDTLLSTLDRGMVAVIAEGDRLHGLITRFDLLNHLRRKL
jgi:cystathionine beta-synthase